MQSFREEDGGTSKTFHTRKSRYYILPCFILFYRSEKILNDVLNVMRSIISGNDLPTFDIQNGHIMSDHSSRIIAVVRVLLLIHEDVRVWQMFLCYKKEIDGILQNILKFVVGLPFSRYLLEEQTVLLFYGLLFDFLV